MFALVLMKTCVAFVANGISVRFATALSSRETLLGSIMGPCRRETVNKLGSWGLLGLLKSRELNAQETRPHPEADEQVIN